MYADKKVKLLYRSFLSLVLVGIICSIFLLSDGDGNQDTGILYDENTGVVDIVNYSVDELQNNDEISDMVSEGEDGYPEASEAASRLVKPVGIPIGIYVKTDGVMVVDTGEVTSCDGEALSPSDGKLMQGDYIKEINGIQITDKQRLTEVINEYGENTLSVTIEREGEELTIPVDAVKGKNDRYMIGLWVKDDISGIGTLTYVTEDGFGALGHSINDNDTGTVFKVSDGAVYPARIINIELPESEAPGRLEGIINYSGENILGRVKNNCEYGISGSVTKAMSGYVSECDWVRAATREEVHTGPAYILSGVSGEAVYYEINIKNVSYSSNDEGRELELEVTDERLIGLTGGIVQGMSGTPILQDGMLVGAVTHVFLRDSTKGYGTFVEDMINSSND